MSENIAQFSSKLFFHFEYTLSNHYFSCIFPFSNLNFNFTKSFNVSDLLENISTIPPTTPTYAKTFLNLYSSCTSIPLQRSTNHFYHNIYLFIFEYTPTNFSIPQYTASTPLPQTSLLLPNPFRTSKNLFDGPTFLLI